MSYFVTQFWYILEQLVPFDLTRIIKDFKHHASISEIDGDENLPWLNQDVLTTKFRLPLGLDRKGNPIEYDYRIYLGIFPLQLVFDFLQVLSKSIAPSFSELASATKNLSCFASFKIDHRGLLVDQSLTHSTVPWTLKQVHSAFKSKKRVNLDGSTEEYP